MNAAVRNAEEGTVEVDLEAPEPVAEQPAEAPAPVPPTPIVAPVAKPRRNGRRTLLMVALPLLLAVGGGYVWLAGGRYEETENANLRQARVIIASEAAGRIVEVGVGENAVVKAGDVLFRVDPEPYRIALAQADAALSAARLNVEQLRAAFQLALAQEKVAAGEVEFQRTQLHRTSDLAAKGISTQSSLDEVQRDLNRAIDQQAAARQSVESARAALGGDEAVETDKHPAVLSALAARDKAAYALAQTTVRAPSDGTVSQASSFKIGQYVAPGTALFSLVETGDTWIEANFKETQITNMRPGQHAEVVIDTWPGHSFEATVESIGAGTGAEFSLLPAQNATGNWVKVTQRIPVRLKLGESGSLPIRTGMSATVTVDTEAQTGLSHLLGGIANAAGL